MLRAVQNAVTPPYPLGAKPQAHELFCAVGHRTRVWIVTGIHSLGEDGVGAKRLEWKSPREPLCVCKGRDIWKRTGSELIARLLRHKWEQDEACLFFFRCRGSISNLSSDCISLVSYWINECDINSRGWHGPLCNWQMFCSCCSSLFCTTPRNISTWSCLGFFCVCHLRMLEETQLLRGSWPSHPLFKDVGLWWRRLDLISPVFVLNCVIPAKESRAVEQFKLGFLKEPLNHEFWGTLWAPLKISLWKDSMWFFFMGFHKFCCLRCPALLPFVYLSSLAFFGEVVGIVADCNCGSAFIEVNSTCLVSSVGQRACFVLTY